MQGSRVRDMKDGQEPMAEKNDGLWSRIKELAEKEDISYLDAAGHRNAKQTTEVARQFCSSLQNESGFQFKNFLHEMLRNTVGDDKAQDHAQQGKQRGRDLEGVALGVRLGHLGQQG